MASPPRVEPAELLDEFAGSLGARSAATVDGYRRAVRQVLDWLAERPGHADGFHPDLPVRRGRESARFGAWLSTMSGGK